VSETDLYRHEETLREVERLRAENERLRTLLTLAQRTQAVLSPTKSSAALHLDARSRRASRPAPTRPTDGLNGEGNARLHLWVLDYVAFDELTSMR
jgi:hypothetical protein